jgi:hypothetical protein
LENILARTNAPKTKTEKLLTTVITSDIVCNSREKTSVMLNTELYIGMAYSRTLLDDTPSIEVNPIPKITI